MGTVLAKMRFLSIAVLLSTAGWCVKAQEGLGEERKSTPLEVTFTPDGSIAYVSGSDRTKRAAPVTTILQTVNLRYCPFRVKSINDLQNYQTCCIHPITRRIPGAPQACCEDHGLCY